MKQVLMIFILGLLITHSKGYATLTVPIAGNCGDDTVLTCSVTGSVGVTGWFGLGRSLMQNGAPCRPEDSNKYTENRGTSSFTLTIHNTSLTDEGDYKCTNTEESQLVRLYIECKASTSILSVTNGKKIIITVDKLYISSLAFNVSFRIENATVTIPGYTRCYSSTQYTGYYECRWFSSDSLADGSYTYSVVVTTRTQADPLTGSFKIVSPQTPVISDTVKLNVSRVVVYGNEGQSLTIQCTSTGGYPTPTVVWYKDSVSRYNQLTYTRTGTLQNDDTYTVTLQHTFTPRVYFDSKSFICRSYYPQANIAHSGSKTASMIFFLKLKPSQPSVTQVRDVSSGGTVEVRCTTTGSRPAANITWSYQGSTSTGVVTSTLDTSAETYTVVSIFRRTVTAADNGHSLKCAVTHTALVSPPERTTSIYLNVQFSVPAFTTSITGNKVMTATGSATLTLTCTTGSSNPVSDITWKNGSVTITTNRPYTTSTGDNNGVVRSQQLVLTPTRYINGDVITCLVSNTVSQSPVADTAILNLNFKPLTTTITGNSNIIANGQNTLSLVCTSGSSNPISDITWRINNKVTSSTAKLSDQSGEYGGMKRRRRLTLTSTRDNDGDTVSCEATNSPATSARTEESLNLKYCPLINPMHDRTSVEGSNTLLPCYASSKPASTFKWYKEGHSVILHQGTGTLASNQLVYTISNVRRTDAGTYRCTAGNGIETTDEKTVLLTVYYPPTVIVVTTNTTIKERSVSVICNASGIPNTGYSYGNWIQKWPGYDVTLSEHTGRKHLQLNTLTYEHSGVYSCSASNGIKVFGTDKEYMEGSAILLVKSYPTILHVSENVTAKLKEKVTLRIDFYSNVEGSDVKCYKKINGTRQTDFACTVSKSHVEVDLPVFSHIIKTDGTRANLSIIIYSKEQFGFYDVIVSNEIGSTVRAIEIVPLGPPSAPTDIKIDSIQYKSVSMSWKRGYHGGVAQTFVIQVSADLINWLVMKSVFDGKNESEKRAHISVDWTSLRHMTSYFLRMYAFNNEGNSSYTIHLNFTTLAEDDPGQNAAVIAGGVSAAVIIAVIIITVLIIRRKANTVNNAGRTSKKTEELPIEMKSPDNNSVGLNEQYNIQHVTDGDKKYESDFFRVKKKQHTKKEPMYENFQPDTSSVNRTDTSRDDNNRTYENFKLRTDI